MHKILYFSSITYKQNKQKSIALNLAEQSLDVQKCQRTKLKDFKLIAHSSIFRDKYSSVLNTLVSNKQDRQALFVSKKSLTFSLNRQNLYKLNSTKWINLTFGPKMFSPNFRSKKTAKKDYCKAVALQTFSDFKKSESYDLLSSLSENIQEDWKDQTKFYTSYSKKNEIKYISIGLASPQKIRKWAEKSLPNGKMIGQVLNANTLHHKTLKPQKGGLFCERIFGPLKDFFCGCGKSSKITMLNKNKGNKKNSSYLSLLSKIQGDPEFDKLTYINKFQSSQRNSLSGGKLISNQFCPDCDIEYTWSVIRRYQLGFIELTLPVTHVWYLKGIPNNHMSVLLGIKRRYLQSIAYCSEKITLENGFNKIEIERTPDELFSSWQKLINQSDIGLNKKNFIKEKNSEVSFTQTEKFGTERLKKEVFSSRNKETKLRLNGLSKMKLFALRKKRQNLKIIKKVNSVKILDLYFKSFKPIFDVNYESISWSLTYRLNLFKPFLNHFPIYSYILKNVDLLIQKDSFYLSNKLLNFFYKNTQTQKYWLRLCKTFMDNSSSTDFHNQNNQIIKLKKNWLVAFEILYKKAAHFNFQKYLVFNFANQARRSSDLRPVFVNHKKNLVLDDKRSFAFQKNCHEFLNKKRKKSQFFKNYPKNWFPKSMTLYQQQFDLIPSFEYVKENQFKQQNCKSSFQCYFSVVPNSRYHSNFAGIWFLITKKTLFYPSGFVHDSFTYEGIVDKKNKHQLPSIINFLSINEGWEINLQKKFSTFAFLFSIIQLAFSATLKLINFDNKKIHNSLKSGTTELKQFNLLSFNFFHSKMKLDWKKNSSKVRKTLILFFYSLKKSLIRKDVRNNNYCFSYRERWFDVDADDDDEKEWPLFSVYLNPENHLFNRPIPFYKNRFIGSSNQMLMENQHRSKFLFSLEKQNLEKQIESWVSSAALEQKGIIPYFRKNVPDKSNNFYGEILTQFMVDIRQDENMSDPSFSSLIKPKNAFSNFCSGPAVLRHLLSEFDQNELKFVLMQNKENMKQLYQSGPESVELRFDSVSEFYKRKLYLVNKNRKLKTQSKQNKKNWLNKLFSNAERYPRFIERQRARAYKKFNLLIRHQKFVKKLIKKSSDPKLMTLTILPVLPPDLRPIVKMDGQVAASDLNRLYQRIIYRNDRLKKLLNNSVMRHSYLMHFGLRLLQESVDNLISNGKSGVTPEKDSRGRLLKSLSDILKGKEGRFRQYLLGKRVDYSGRSVIVVGPKLKLYECGIPKEMAFELFLPFLLKTILNQKLARTIIGAKNLIKKKPALAWELLQETMQTSPVLLNRAPTLHRLGIQAFKPKLIEGRAILLHPLVCSAFNADFDGDQMAVHIPLTVEARAEAWKLMLSINNLLSPATGEPLAIPSQDMVLGCYYLTTNCNEQNIQSQKGSGLYFTSLIDVLKSYENKQLDLHAIIWLKWNGLIENGNDQDEPVEIRVNSYGNYQEIYPKVQKNYDKDHVLINQYVATTPGKVIFNYIVKKRLTSFNFTFL